MHSFDCCIVFLNKNMLQQSYPFRYWTACTTSKTAVDTLAQIFASTSLPLIFLTRVTRRELLELGLGAFLT